MIRGSSSATSTSGWVLTVATPPGCSRYTRSPRAQTPCSIRRTRPRRWLSAGGFTTSGLVLATPGPRMVRIASACAATPTTPRCDRLAVGLRRPAVRPHERCRGRGAPGFRGPNRELATSAEGSDTLSAMRFRQIDLHDLHVAREVRIETHASTGVIHSTIVWIVVDDGELFVRSVRGERGRWFQEALGHADVTVDDQGRRLEASAIPLTDAARSPASMPPSRASTRPMPATTRC